MDTVRILIVEDDPDTAQLIALHLRDVGYQVDAEEDGVMGLEQAISGHYALIVLDVALTGLSGTELCRRLRAKNSDTLILMLAAEASKLDRAPGLELGADDYLTKVQLPRTSGQGQSLVAT